MADIEHSDAPIGERHAPYNWVWANGAERLAQAVSAADYLKKGYQVDEDAEYILKSYSPATWRKISTIADVLGMYGVNNFGASNYYFGTNPTGEAGLAAGFGYACLFSVDSQAVGSATRVIHVRGLNTNARAHQLVTTGTNGSLQFGVATSGSIILSPAYTIGAGDVGKIMLAVGIWDGSGTPNNQVRLYVANALVGTNTTTTNTLDTSNGPTYTGKRSDSFAADGITFFGALQFQGVPSLANIQAYRTACIAAADIVDAITGGTPTHSYSVKRDQSGSAPAILDDKIGSADLTKTGSVALSAVPSPVWL